MRIFRKKAERRSRKQKNTVGLGFENLEDRRLMAGSIDLDGGVLEIDGTNASDTVNVQHYQYNSNYIKVTLQHDSTTHTRYYRASDVNSIRFEGGDGTTISVTTRTSVRGHTGETATTS